MFYSDWPGKMRLPLLNSAVYKRVMAPLFGMQMIGRDANDTSGFSTILQVSSAISILLTMIAVALMLAILSCQIEEICFISI